MNAWRESVAGSASRNTICGAIRVALLALPLAALAVMSSPQGARAATGPASRQGSAAPAAPASGSTGKTGGQAASGQTGSAQAGADLPIPADEIIRRFAQHESDFKLARDNYTYTQEVVIQEGDGGEYRLVTDIVFTPEGKRYEHDTYAPPSTLQQILLTAEDKKDLESIQPFVLTTEDLPKYDVKYTGREKIDEVNTYVFQVAPKRMEKNQRYFQGTVWVDDHDFAVVKSDGKAVPDIKDNLFPRFITYRENIEGTFWFPTYTHADDELHFKNGDVHILMTVRYKNYKRFGSTIKLGPSKTVDAPPNPAAPNPAAPNPTPNSTTPPQR